MSLFADIFTIIALDDAITKLTTHTSYYVFSIDWFCWKVCRTFIIFGRTASFWYGRLVYFLFISRLCFPYQPSMFFVFFWDSGLKLPIFGPFLIIEWSHPAWFEDNMLSYSCKWWARWWAWRQATWFLPFWHTWKQYKQWIQ